MTSLCVAVGKGDTHDLKLFQASKTKVHPETEVIADAEYQGLQQARLCAWTPHEATKLQPLIPDQKAGEPFHVPAASTRGAPDSLP